MTIIEIIFLQTCTYYNVHFDIWWIVSNVFTGENQFKKEYESEMNYSRVCY